MSSNQDLRDTDGPAHQLRPPDLQTLPPASNDLVLLRRWQPDDLPAIDEASTDPYIPLVTTVPSPYSPEQGTAWLQRQEDQAARGLGCPQAIVARHTQTVVGMATITGIDWTHHRAAIGYWILSRHRGHGYARAAVVLLPVLARQLGIIRLQALVETSNHASQAVCRSVGFIEEGILRQYYRIGDHNRDMIMFAMLLSTAHPT
jgi:RimJ/RimL family protein N-acetyltransferase